MIKPITLLIILTIFLASCANQQVTGDVVKNVASDAKEIKVKAFRFCFEPDTITINRDEKVRFVIDNLDTPHGMRFPDFGVAGTDNVEFVANKTGSFPWYCYIPCGPGHKAMNGTLVVI